MEASRFILTTSHCINKKDTKPPLYVLEKIVNLHLDDDLLLHTHFHANFPYLRHHLHLRKEPCTSSAYPLLFFLSANKMCHLLYILFNKPPFMVMHL